MSAIEGMSPKMYAMACDDITIRTDDRVTVNVVISVPGVGEVHNHTSTYYPVGGIVVIGELGELCNRCIQQGSGFTSLVPEQGRVAECTLTIEIPQEQVSSTATVYYCRKAQAGIRAGAVCFATASRDRRLALSQRLQLYVPGNMNLSVNWCMAYILNDHVVYSSERETIQSGQDTYNAIDASPSVQASMLADGAELIFYDVELYDGEMLCDRVHVDIMDDEYRQKELVFINMFGVQETVLLTGDDEEEQQHEAGFDYHMTQYQKYDTLLTEQHETGSGCMDGDGWLMLCDMLDSPAVALREGEDIIPIVITDAEAKRTLLSEDPGVMIISWRAADRKAMRRMKFAPDTATNGVFEQPVFDDTFV